MSPTRADDEAGEAYDSAGDAGDSGGLVGADAVSAAIAADESETKVKNLCGNIPAGKKYFLVPALYILEAYRIKEVSQLQRTFFLFPRRAGGLLRSSSSSLELERVLPGHRRRRLRKRNRERRC